MRFFSSKKRINELTATLDAALKRIADLEKERGITQSILGSMAEGMIAVDKDTRIIAVNPSIEKIFGITKEAALGRFFLEVIRNNDIAELISKVLKNGEFVFQEISLTWPDQKVFHINASPIFEQNTISGSLLVIHDITEIRRLERIRSDFVANVSHELKTPLTSIKGFIETLLEGALDDKDTSRQFLKIVQSHSDRLESLVNDLLALSSLESGGAKLNLIAFDMHALIEKVLSGFKSQISKKGLGVHNDVYAGFTIKADRDKLEQVLTNLIDNAIKFNKEKGELRVSIEDMGHAAKIIVADTGLGIPERDIARIFERFYRADKARSRELGGTGLGLSIVKHIVELHGGSVGVESTEGLGSKFWFTLPK